MQEQNPFTHVQRALNNSQIDTAKRIEKLETRLADLDTNLTDATVKCKERKKLRYTRGKIVSRIETERHNLVAATNALADTDLRIQTALHLHSPPLSPFMPFPMSPMYAPSPMSPLSPLFSPGPQFSNFPQHLWMTQNALASVAPGQEAALGGQGDVPHSPGYWVQSPIYEHGYLGPFEPPSHEASSAASEQPQQNISGQENTEQNETRNKENSAIQYQEEGEVEKLSDKEKIISADKEVEDSSDLIVVSEERSTDEETGRVSSGSISNGGSSSRNNGRTARHSI